MNFASASTRFEWVKYSSQMDSDVTYVYVLNRLVPRLRGESDILYIGKTSQAIRVRFEQETRTRNSPGNTQQTNIRTTHILGALGLENVQLYYVRALEVELSDAELSKYMNGLETWDKKSFISASALLQAKQRKPSLEKVLLVSYAADHLEVPPLNNRM
ncbi:MAG: hypothetical protein ACRESU_02790 [Gammaproteobacteria bacterium]